MKVAEDPNLERRQQPQVAAKRRYEPPRLLAETMDVRGTNKTNTSIIDLHNASVFSGS